MNRFAAAPRHGWAGALAGVAAAIAITTTMDANGLSAFSALPLMPLAALYWYLERHSRREIGLVPGQPRDYALAIAHPAAVLGTAVAIGIVAGAADPASFDWGKAWRDFLLMAGATIPVVILTEEGFFRGWLFASLGKRGLGGSALLLWSSIAFSLWHLSAVSLNTGFDLPVRQIPLFMVNAAILGGIWGMLRLTSGSVIVASVSHGLWNGGAYVLFGYGQKTGALGIVDTAVFGPETGLVGLALNLLFLATLARTRKA